MLTTLPRLLYGADYNPDQWPDEVVGEDVRLMREAGVNLVSLGIFSWARLEPRRDAYHFDWLDGVIERLHAGGISVNLATPTAAPPAWLSREDPDVLPVDVNGTRLLHGSRRHYCPHSPTYRERARAIAGALADRYGEHPAVVLWHIDNEYMCHVSECFCEASVHAFRIWLERRYESLDRLNDAWSTSFWSQVYGAWEEIGSPRPVPALGNPAQHLDWRRFFSDSFLECFDEQATVVRARSRDLPVTTNFFLGFPPLDHFEWAKHEDLVSMDSYPETSAPDWMIDAGMTCDATRSVGDGRPWLLMEQAPAHVQWRERNGTKRPGVMRLASYQALARGADGVMFFQWRASLGGAERFHSAMLPHGGTDTRTWREVSALGAELGRLDELIDSRPRAEVALLFDWDNLWALEAGTTPSVDLRPLDEVRSWYAALFEQNVLVDLVHPVSDLSRYKLVIAPMLHVVDEAAIASMRAVVEGDGCLVLTFFSGIADGETRVYPGAYPAPFADLLGISVEESVAFADGHTGEVVVSSGESFETHIWADVIRTAGAEAVAYFADDFYAGRPAVTRHRPGTGEAWYVGTRLDAAGASWLARRLCAAAGVATPDLPAGLEVIVREGASHDWTFALNHTAERLSLPLVRPGVEMLSGADVTTSIEIGPTDVAIVRSPRTG